MKQREYEAPDFRLKVLGVSADGPEFSGPSAFL